MSGSIQNGVKYTVFNLLNIKYGYIFKRPDLLLKFKAFTIAAKKSIWRHITTNRYKSVEVTIADVI